MRRLALLIGLLVAMPATASATEPPLATPQATLDAALRCPAGLSDSPGAPVLLVHGTGGSGEEEWNGPAPLASVLTAGGNPACYVELPRYALADIQVAAEYVVAAARTMHARARRPIGLYGHSQGGLLVRWALTYWPSLRPLVSDAVPVAGTLHGTTWGTQQPTISTLCTAAAGCPPAFWQQTIGSRMLDALNTGRDETPGPTAWTTVRSTTDELVQPQTGPRPTSAADGARNIAVQDVCPGREANHVQAAFDSVAIAALLDALAHDGPADPARFAADVCTHRFGAGLDPAQVDALSQSSRPVIATRLLGYTPQAKAEPAVQSYATAAEPRPATCGARRVTLRLPRAVRRATVTVGGRRRAVRRRDGRLQLTLAITRRTVVRVVGTTRAGRRYRTTRTYRPCP